MITKLIKMKLHEPKFAHLRPAQKRTLCYQAHSVNAILSHSKLFTRSPNKDFCFKTQAVFTVFRISTTVAKLYTGVRIQMITGYF